MRAHPNPKTLENANASQSNEFLKTLTKFEYLRTLILRTQTISNDFGNKIVGRDIDLESAKETMSYVQTHQSSGLLSKFSMIVLKRLCAPVNLPPHPQCASWDERNLITRRSFVFLKKSDKLEVKVVDREVSVIRPKVCSHGQHISRYKSECSSLNGSGGHDELATFLATPTFDTIQ
jgi:hypothetical protein